MTRPFRLLLLTLALTPMACSELPIAEASAPPALRVATFNTSLNDDQGRLIARLQADDLQARKIAAVIQRIRPDLLVLNEFDYDAQGEAAQLFVERYLGASQFEQRPIHYPYRFSAEVNTGVPSGLDIDGNGKIEGPNDAWGFGHHPGQFGMLVLSRFPIDRAAARSFQKLRWSQMPGAKRPMQPALNQPFHPDAIWQQLRLSSKSHWDLPVDTPQGRLHFLLSHPTPPVFDGPENLNGLRNFDEIGFWARYVDGGDAAWLVDDQGRVGGLPAGQRFVLAGDLNADPQDGSNLPGCINQLLQHSRMLDYPAPRSEGALESNRQGNSSQQHKTDPATDTAMFSGRAGNLRVDYVVPSREWQVVDSGVFWPTAEQPEAEWLTATDHRMVWLDLQAQPQAENTEAPAE